MESFFYSYGKAISSHPISFILFCLFFTGLCGLGLTKFTQVCYWFKADILSLGSSILTVRICKMANFDEQL
jgi:hypothetical protein